MSTHPPHLRMVAPEPTQRPVAPPTPDAAWIEQARRGDVRAWSALYESRYAGVFRRLRYLTGDRAVAEELAQETFAQAMAHHKRYDGRRPFDAWLHGIALNIARKHHRKQRNRGAAMQRLQNIPLGGHSDPAGTHLRRERSRMLYAVLDELPDRWREAFVLREIQGLSTSEAAQVLGISVANLSVRVTRARARIREELVRRGWVGEGAS